MVLSTPQCKYPKNEHFIIAAAYQFSGEIVIFECDKNMDVYNTNNRKLLSSVWDGNAGKELDGCNCRWVWIWV